VLRSVRPHVLGLVLIGTVAAPLGNATALVKIPTPIIEIFRAIDRFGGVNSKSVLRMMHPDTPVHLKARQLSLAASNLMSNIKPLVLGMSWTSEDEWKNLDLPFILIHGDSDHVTPAARAASLSEWCQAHIQGAHVIPRAGHIVMMEKSLETNALIKTFLDEALGLEQQR